VAGLAEKPQHQDDTILALGASHDPRALRPLVTVLLSDKYYVSGLAARALGDVGLPAAEPYLLEALDRKSH
jgi:HEAT repeat protein